MPPQLCNGDQAMGYGALVAGVSVVTSYPGSPSSGTVEALIALADRHDLDIEWSSNERVALEIAIGTSIAGRRALVATKSVGLNVMLDPLMALNLTPVHGGLVILLGDDPGGYGSQNDQDTRPLAPMLEMPLLEPATPADGFAMMREAFDASERLGTPVIVRETRSFTQQSEAIDIPEDPDPKPDRGLVREPWRFVPVPRNVVAKHRALHERLDQVQRWVEELPFHQATGSGDRGLLGVGFAYRKLGDVLGEGLRDDLTLLKLGAHYPLPVGRLDRFLSGCHDLLVVEEIEPFVELQLQALAHARGHRVQILGKASGHLPREGELFRWQIQKALERFLPDFVPARRFTEEGEAAERPSKEGHCAGCRFGEILDLLEAVAAEFGQKPLLVGDPGCLVTVAERLVAKYAIGSAVGVADGLSRAGLDERAVALFGDSAFFHSAIPAICNAVVRQSPILMVVLDNGATVTSGFQPNPGVGRDARGRPAPALAIERIARACGVPFVRTVDHDALGPRLRDPIREAFAHPGPALLVIRTPCDPSPRPAGHSEAIRKGRSSPRRGASR